MILRMIAVPCCILICLSCAASSIAPERMRAITGTWRTEQDIDVEIGPAEGGGYAATIVRAPGFLAEQGGPGTVIMNTIRAQADGSFTAIFHIPGAEPATVRIGLAPPGGLVIVTRDNRRRGGTMIWRRVGGLEPFTP